MFQISSLVPFPAICTPHFKLGLRDYMPFKIGITDYTSFEIGIMGLQDFPLQSPKLATLLQVSLDRV